MKTNEIMPFLVSLLVVVFAIGFFCGSAFIKGSTLDRSYSAGVTDAIARDAAFTAAYEGIGRLNDSARRLFDESVKATKGGTTAVRDFLAYLTDWLDEYEAGIAALVGAIGAADEATQNLADH